MDMPTIHPPALRRGDTIAVVAPAGPLKNRQALNDGIARLERLGFRVRCEERVFRSLRYLAGPDADRAEELTGSFEDPEIKAVVALRGGYGCARLLPLLDEGRLRHNCKAFMGFSDLTTLHLFFCRRLGWITLHGPMAASPSLGEMTVAQEDHLFSLLTDPGYIPRFHFPGLEEWVPGVAEGKLTGGCLSMITASLGTPYEIRTEGKILFLEDLEEPPYRIDRMLTQLLLAGKLDRLAGLILGQFTNCEEEGESYTLEECLREFCAHLKVPVMSGFPAGHGRENWAFPLGIRVRLDTSEGCIEALESTVRASNC